MKTRSMFNKQSRSRFQFSAGAAAVIALFIGLVMVIGCGGGGGGNGLTTSSGGTSSGGTTATSAGTTSTGSSAGTTSGTGTTGFSTTGSSASTGTTSGTTGSSTTGTTGSTTTGGTTSGTTGGTTGSTTGGTTGSTTGNLPANTLIYDFSTLAVTSTTINVHSIKPNGTGDTQLVTYASNVIQAICPDPAIANGYVIALQNNNTGSSYDLYFTIAGSNGLPGSSSTRLTNQNFTSISNVQFSQDGSHIIVVGTTTGTSALFSMAFSDSNNNPQVSGFTQLDSADDAYLAENGSLIAYTKEISNLGQIFLVNINGSGKTQLTTDNADHFAPQIDKGSGFVCWVQTPPGTGLGSIYDVWEASTSGVGSHQVTNVGANRNATTPCFSADGNLIGFVLVDSSNSANSGIYSIGTSGSNLTSIVLNTTIRPNLYWTNLTGTGFIPGMRAAVPLGGSNYHIARLEREGYWRP